MKPFLAIACVGAFVMCGMAIGQHWYMDAYEKTNDLITGSGLTGLVIYGFGMIGLQLS